MNRLSKSSSGRQGQLTLPLPSGVILGAEIARRYLVSGTPVSTGVGACGFRATDLLTRRSVFAELIVSGAAAASAEALRKEVPLDGAPLEVLVDEHRLLVVRRPFTGAQTPRDPMRLGTALLHATAAAQRLGLGTGLHSSEIVLDRGRPRLVSLKALLEEPLGIDALKRQLRALDRERFSPLCDAHDDVRDMARAHAGIHQRARWPESPPLVGIASLVGRLETRLTTAAASSVVLSGPAGIGKTRTLRELAKRLSHRGMRVAFMRADTRADGPVLLWAAASTVGPDDDAVLKQVRARLSAMPGMSPDWLEDPTAPGPPEAIDLDVDGRHRRYCRVLAESVLELLTARGTGVLCIDDADQLGPGTQAVLAEIRALDLKDRRLVMVATARDADAVDSTIALSHMAIPGLDADAVAELIEASVPEAACLPHLAQRLIDQVGGRPLHLWTWLRHLTDTGEIWSPEAASASALVDLQARRISALGPTARSALYVAAIHPEPWDATDLALVLGETTPATLDLIATLAATGLARSDGGRTLQIAHATAAESVVHSMDRAEGRDLHQAIARWLARTGGTTLCQVVRHREFGTPSGVSAPLAEEHLDAARQALSTYDLDVARWHLECALERAPGQAQSSRARRHLAHVDLLTGQLSDAKAAYLQLVDEASPDQALTIAREAMYGFYRRNASDAALQLGRRALSRAGEWIPTSSAVQLFALLFTLVRRRKELPAVRDGIAAVYALMIPLAAASQPSLLALSIWRARRLAWDLPTHAGASANAFTAMFLSTLSFRERADASLAKADEAAEQCGSPLTLGTVAHIRGQIELAYGEYEAGQRTLSAAVDAFGQAGDMTHGTISLLLKADYGLHREPDPTLRRWLVLADDAARTQGNQLVRPSIAALELLIDARAGHDITDRSASIRRRLDGLDASTLDAVLGRGYLALALLEAGSPSDAALALETIQDSLPSLGSGLEIAQVVHLALGRVALAATPPDLALARTCIQSLAKVGGKSPRALAASRLLEAERATCAGDAATARAVLADLVDQQAYGETHLLAAAELRLGTLTDEPHLIEQGESRVIALRGVPSKTRLSDTEALHPILSSLRELMAPRAITIDVSELTRLDDAATSVVLLAAMAVRDQTTGEVRLRMATRRVGDATRTVIDIAAGGASQSTPLGLTGVRQAVEALNGELAIGPSLGTRRFVIELPPARVQAEVPRVGVRHSNPLVTEALERAIRGLGYAVGNLDPVLTVAEPGLPVGGNVALVVPRGSPLEQGNLAFPFGLGELAKLLQERVGPPVATSREDSA
ncbi:MAG: AAA family ATPase [Proteobacteria bacterium]|nr:AAA family ATPase [Pseudomonadota bacterium]